METIKIDFNKPDLETIKQAAEIIQSGGVVVFPSDTVYGLAADATNPKTIEKVFKIKERTYNKAFSTIVRDLDMTKKYCQINDEQEKCLKKYLPGKITFILPAQQPNLLPGDNPSIRIPDIPVTNMLSQILDFPYTATSANPTTKPSSYSPQDIHDYFDNASIQPDLFLDAGTLPPNPPSTVIDLTTNPPKIIRQGPVIFDPKSC